MSRTEPSKAWKSILDGLKAAPEAQHKVTGYKVFSGGELIAEGVIAADNWGEGEFGATPDREETYEYKIRIHEPRGEAHEQAKG